MDFEYLQEINMAFLQAIQNLKRKVKIQLSVQQ